LAIAAQSGVGLNQSVLLANALVDRFAGNARIFDYFPAFRMTKSRSQHIRSCARRRLQLGMKVGSLSTLRSMRNMINRTSIAAARASELVDWRSRPAV
jgi:hypothetical protein